MQSKCVSFVNGRAFSMVCCYNHVINKLSFFHLAFENKEETKLSNNLLLGIDLLVYITTCDVATMNECKKIWQES